MNYLQISIEKYSHSSHGCHEIWTMNQSSFCIGFDVHNQFKLEHIVQNNVGGACDELLAWIPIMF